VLVGWAKEAGAGGGDGLSSVITLGLFLPTELGEVGLVFDSKLLLLVLEFDVDSGTFIAFFKYFSTFTWMRDQKPKIQARKLLQ
jgi:hypothetical protein